MTKTINIGQRELDPRKIRIDKFVTPTCIMIDSEGNEVVDDSTYTNNVTGMTITDGAYSVYVAFDRKGSYPMFNFTPGLRN